MDSFHNYGYRLDESDLIKLVKEGSLEAFEPLMDMYMAKIRAFVALKAPVPHLVEDVAHDTFVYAWKNIDQFKLGTQFGNWLIAIAHNKLRQEVQKFARTRANKEKFLDQLIIESNREMVSHENKALDHLQTCLTQLPESQAKILELKYKLSLSTKELAKKINKSETWVRTNLFRVRKALKLCIEAKLKPGVG